MAMKELPLSGSHATLTRATMLNASRKSHYNPGGELAVLPRRRKRYRFERGVLPRFGGASEDTFASQYPAGLPAAHYCGTLASQQRRRISTSPS